MFYKKRMEGNRERIRARDRKTVEEGSHLLPRVRGSERVRAEEDMIGVEELVEEVPMVKVRKSGKVKRRLLVGGGSEEVMDVD